MATNNRFLVVDDHEVVRTGMAIAIKKMNAAAEITGVGSYARALEEIDTAGFKLVILDVNLPDGNNLSMPATIKKRGKDTKVLMFTATSEPNFAMRYLRSGADGFLCKDASDAEIQTAIETVLRGELYMSSQVKDFILSGIVNPAQSKNPLDRLSHRESDILKYVLNGKSISEIAQELDLSPSTVSTYKARIFQKMQVTNLMDLVKKIKTYE